ncbi:YopX family protein [Enterococcus hirae]|nr:YopX family protein [Enterococcus hirae]MCH1978120.1 YopX family protein [Enterococcus hirae]
MIPKFRAWDRYEEAMTNQDGIYFGAMDHDETLESLILCLEERYELMQSTGLKDKNGVEIFEGDLVSISVQNGFDYLDKKVCIVKNSIDYSGLVCASVDEDLEYRIFNTELFEEYTYEVIGNIYENSELLEEQR